MSIDIRVMVWFLSVAVMLLLVVEFQGLSLKLVFLIVESFSELGIALLEEGCEFTLPVVDNC